ncbi:MAG: AAA family ATPase [Bacteroidia bacterium]
MTKRILLTGGPGFGKSSIIAELERSGHHVFHEVAREIIQEETSKMGDALPWKNIQEFSSKVLQGRIDQFEIGRNKISFYDRGLPDIVAFLVKDKNPIPQELMNLCQSKKYFDPVFITPPWESIFHRDEERKEDFNAAIKVHKAIEQIFPELGYQLISIPMGSVKWRSEFVLSKLGMM